MYETIWRNLYFKESILRQKARHRCVVEGDLNTRFFHILLKSRTRRNGIFTLQTETGVVEGVEAIKEEVKNHFAKRFLKHEVLRPSMERLEFKKPTQDECWKLKVEFSKEEIK